jgi:hypothetical protein
MSDLEEEGSERGEEKKKKKQGRGDRWFCELMG